MFLFCQLIKEKANNIHSGFILQFVLYFFLSGKGKKKEEHFLPPKILLTSSFTINSKK